MGIKHVHNFSIAHAVTFGAVLCAQPLNMYLNSQPHIMQCKRSHRLLLYTDGGGGLEGNAHNDVLAVGEAPLHTPTAVCPCADLNG